MKRAGMLVAAAGGVLVGLCGVAWGALVALGAGSFGTDGLPGARVLGAVGALLGGVLLFLGVRALYGAGGPGRK